MAIAIYTFGGIWYNEAKKEQEVFHKKRGMLDVKINRVWVSLWREEFGLFDARIEGCDEVFEAHRRVESAKTHRTEQAI